MTFTTKIKEEITRTEVNELEDLPILSSFVRFNGNIKNNQIVLTMENAAIARYIDKLIKKIFMINPQIVIRNQRRFRIKSIYLLVINHDIKEILKKLNIIDDKQLILPDPYFLSDDEAKVAYLKGLFLASGSITNPQTSGYHFEYVVTTKKEAEYINSLMHSLNFTSKILKRAHKYIIYLKQSEMISDLLKLFNATESMFFFEDIRIYRDHKNMVNRLNNVDLANQAKTIATAQKELQDIRYLEEHDLISLLDERVQEVIKYRIKYPETSFQELAQIVSSETNRSITKSGINHYFRKIKDLVNKHQNKM
jgi:cell division protein WhiA